MSEHDSTTSALHEGGDCTMIHPTTMTRRRIVAGTAGLGLAATLGLSAVRAQDEATPEPTTGSVGESIADATPAAGVGGQTDDDLTDDDAAESGEQVAERIAAATETIETIQSDLAAVATEIETPQIDELLARAVDLRDRAQTALDGGDDGAIRLARGAHATARAAGDLLRAELTYPGLPSQEVAASRILAAAFERIEAVGAEIGDSTDADVGLSLTSAQTIYATAFDRYGAGAYAQAAATARVGAELAAIAVAFADDDGFGFDGGRGGPGDGRGRRARGGFDGGTPGGGNDDDAQFETAEDEPTTVPSPDF